jgi:hypothetical protein
MTAEFEDDDINDSEDEYDMSLSDESLDDLVDEDAVVEDDDDIVLDPKERAARSLEIRRAIEARLEARRMQRDLDYLDLELDDEDA